MSGRNPYNNKRGNGSNWRGRGWQSQGWKRGNFRGRGRVGINSSGASRRGGYDNVSSGSSVSTTQPLIISMLPPVHCPFKGWHLYISYGYSDHSETTMFIKTFRSYIESIHTNKLKDKITEKHFLKVDIQHIVQDKFVLEKIPTIASKIINSPQLIIDCLGVAIYQIIYEEIELEAKENTRAILEETAVENINEETLADSIKDLEIPVIRARLYNLSKLIKLKKFKAIYYGKLVSFKGTVVRVGNIKPLCISMVFSCVNCGAVTAITQPEGKYTTPSSCSVAECKGRLFTPLLNHKFTHAVDWQKIKLQEIICDEQREGGRVPRTTECELREDLVDSCVPGDVVTVTGIVKVYQSEDVKVNKADKCMFELYLDVSSVINSKEGGGEIASNAGIEFRIEDYYAIQEIQAEPNLFKLLVQSLCPTIYGHEMVKAGLLLCMFGGSSPDPSQECLVRSDPHILVVGDPGLGKSQMLQACANIAPRGVYVCGNTTTTSGLTVTLTRESGSGDYALEGGALVLADQGVCCIDEFDKMSTQHQALLEAMEQQCISIAKAGIVCSLPARTSILAAANPIGGHYNKAKTVSENLKMNSALLSRFDLVFILLDKPDEEMDCLLSEHVMAIHSGNKKPYGLNSLKITPADLNTPSKATQDRPLNERLRYSEEVPDPIIHELLRKYICYARKYVHPRLSPEAAVVLQQFYLDLRQKHQNSDSTPITTRQLESLIRLSQARAKCELRELVTEQDAFDVIDIMKFSMVDTYSDEFGFLDFQRSHHGSGNSTKGQMKKFITALQKISDNTYKSVFNLDEMKNLMKQVNIQVRDFQEFIEGLNHHGYLLKAGNRSYKLLTANC